MLQRFRLYLAFLLLCLGVAGWKLSTHSEPPTLPALLHSEHTTWVWGRVAGLTRHGPDTLRFAFEVEGVNGHDPGSTGRRLQVPVKVWVHWSVQPDEQVALNIRPGETWQLPVRWQAIRSSSTSHGFDQVAWMRQQGLSGLAQVAPVSLHSVRPRRLRTAWFSMESLRQDVRDNIFKRIGHTRQAGLVVALSLGDQNAVDPRDWETFRKTGVAHLVSISGMHVTLLATWLAWGADALWRRSRWKGISLALHIPAPVVAQWVALFAAGIYAMFSGWGLPAQRTVWMLLATQFLALCGWTWPAYAIWLFLIAAIALLDPWALTQSGFWLSYVAVGLLYAMKSEASGSALREWFTETLGMQWRITWALAPMTLYFFQGVSVAGLWVNLWAIPWVTLVVTPLSLLGMICPPLWTWAGWSAGWLWLGLDWAASSPWALLEVSAPPGGWLLRPLFCPSSPLCRGHGPGAGGA